MLLIRQFSKEHNIFQFIFDIINKCEQISTTYYYYCMYMYKWYKKTTQFPINKPTFVFIFSNLRIQQYKMPFQRKANALALFSFNEMNWIERGIERGKQLAICSLYINCWQNILKCLVSVWSTTRFGSVYSIYAFFSTKIELIVCTRCNVRHCPITFRSQEISLLRFSSCIIRILNNTQCSLE